MQCHKRPCFHLCDLPGALHTSHWSSTRTRGEARSEEAKHERQKTRGKARSTRRRSTRRRSTRRRSTRRRGTRGTRGEGREAKDERRGTSNRFCARSEVFRCCGHRHGLPRPRHGLPRPRHGLPQPHHGLPQHYIVFSDVRNDFPAIDAAFPAVGFLAAYEMEAHVTSRLYYKVFC